MARRFFKGRRRSGGPFQKRRLSWVNTVFNESAQDRGGNITERNILIASDWQADEAALQKRAHVKRILIKGGLGMIPESTAQAGDIVALFAALYVIDADDTDNTIISVAAQTILTGCRVLWTGCWTWGSLETAGFIENAYPNTGRVDLDIDVRANFALQADQVVILGMQFGSDVTATIATAAASFYSRTLIEQP